MNEKQEQSSVKQERSSAYELAEIMTTHDGSQVWEHGLEIAIMLRQQASELDKVIPQLVKANGLIENLRIRIAELDKENDRLQDHMTELRKIHTERIEALEKELAYTKAMNGVVFK